MMRRGLFGGGAMQAAIPTARGVMDRARPDEDEQRPRGLFGGGLGRIGQAFSQDSLGQRNNAGVSRGEQLGAMLMSLAGPQQQGQAMQMLSNSRERGRDEQMMQAERQREEEQRRQVAEQERQRIYGQAQALGMDPREFSMLPEATRNELFNRQYTPEEQEPNLREFGGSMYDFSDPQNPRMVMQGQEPRRDIETVVIDGRLVNRRTGEMIADYSDPNEGQPSIGDFNQQQTMAAEYANRMERAGGVVDRLYRVDDPNTEEDESAQNQLNPTARLRTRNIGIPGTNIDIGTAFSGDSVRQYEQAVDEFALALLRRESGAAISASEREEVARTYFPQPGDGPQTVRQKAEARRSVIDGMRQASGGAYGVMFGGQQSGGDVIEIDY